MEKVVNDLYDKKDVITTQLIDVKSDLSVSESLKSDNEQNKKEIIKIKAKIKKDVEMIENLKLLKESFSQNGLKAMIIDYIIPRLEDKVNDILSKLSDFRISLDTQRDGVSEDTLLEGLFISIFNENGEEFDFDNYSGGEKLKIVVAISEALSEVQNVGFRVLDELFIGLDEESTENFAEVMETLQEKFKQIVCISHLRNIKDMFDKKIIIRKTNGSSVISK